MACRSGQVNSANTHGYEGVFRFMFLPMMVLKIKKRHERIEFV